MFDRMPTITLRDEEANWEENVSVVESNLSMDGDGDGPNLGNGGTQDLR